MMKRIAMAASLVLALAACQGEGGSVSSTRHLAPIPPATMALMSTKGMSKDDPILMRSFKKESEIEVWKRGRDGKYALLKTYPMCRWSGQLGPKVREGDRQAPEGFYTVTPAAMNPNSQLYLSFNLGYPNAYDRAHGRTGSHLMVHGSCSSMGCFAMTDEAISEVYALARESFASGQRGFQFQSFPFRMTAENLAKHRYDPNIAFWRNLKEGSDIFEVAKEEPQVSVANRQYAFGGNASVMAAVAQKRQEDEQEVAELVAKGVQPIRLVYDDGGQHQTFRQALAGDTSADGSSLAVDVSARNRLGDVSRPEALAAGPQEIVLAANGKPRQEPPSALAYASQKPAAGQARAAEQSGRWQTPAAAAAPEPAAPASGGERPSTFGRVLAFFGG
ncbi:murein L,D-transpeptidase family protein [Microvirga sp. CF3062]|uniref:murein L,D-transpeptidase family protein n=1 Tax=Microvirga sp. CF3062 TaxID=3110182 RepID=UPI002E79E7E8|nr:murein L,D-transpeptidase family protein [Microvirga sp. CF3062]MEE1657887.1 murein L,D-transpeptidase family protein [Microvirga sp. CF3062]